MFTIEPQFVIKGIDRDGREVQASHQQFNSVYKAELETLNFYGDSRFKFVWVERLGYGNSANQPLSNTASS